MVREEAFMEYGRDIELARKARSRVARPRPAAGGIQQLPETSVDESRNRFMEAMTANPMNLAEGAMGFLGQSAQGYANQLMPELDRGLKLARSRFGGGAIRSGGAQQMEELAFQRLFSDPLQNRIAQLSTTALDFGQREAQRGVDNYGSLLNFDENRFMNRAGLFEDRRQFDARLSEEQRQFNRQQKSARRAGIGKLLGTVAGGVGGFLIGGPAGAFAGARTGGSIFGGG